MRAWQAHFCSGEISFVVVGTKVPRDHFNGFSNLNWTSNTGSFDDETRHRKYISRFLPPAYAASPEGERFLQRAWTWTRGIETPSVQHC
ncbi:hypothetical protein FB45DRAFT_914624 [Roridomyces roridus]|uniref:Uncharacterized protein n=1 Tax=Roridomyces roridus TaxID=1738132 RepID=A0AAD7FR44_9AGAR|nr:hypothetical protein FB45DRAFT_914624 [Roridomyces roridus]